MIKKNQKGSMLTIDKADPKRQPASATRGPYLSPSDDNMICKTSRCQAFNPLISPNIHIQFLQTGLSAFP